MKIKFVLLIFLGIIFQSCKTDIKKVNELSSSKELNKEEGVNVDLMVLENGIKKYRIQAPRSIRNIGPEQIMEFPEGMKVFTYNQFGVEESHLTAEYGTMIENNGQISRLTVRNNVHVLNKKGEEMNTEELNWDHVNDRVWTDRFIKIVTKDEIIYGEGFESNQDFTSYVIKKITGTIQVQNQNLP